MRYMFYRYRDVLAVGAEAIIVLCVSLHAYRIGSFVKDINAREIFPRELIKIEPASISIM